MNFNIAAVSIKKNKFNKNKTDLLCGKIGGVCYMPKTLAELFCEKKIKTLKRIESTMGSGHHSVFEHMYITLNLENIPKLFAMVLNNQNVYVTSEKSARYTRMQMTEKEEALYNKWQAILQQKIRQKYPDASGFMSNTRVKKLAQENARYLISVKTPTTMVHTVSYRQLNYLCKWMTNELEKTNSPYTPIFDAFAEFVNFAKSKNLLDERLMDDGKHRHLSLFNLGEKRNEVFDTVYSMNYDATFAYYAQNQRHRTLYNEINQITDKFITPKILLPDQLLSEEWQEDIYSLKDNLPQGTLLSINERGILENFVLKLKERLCSCAQLEINDKSKELLERYIKETPDPEIAKYLESYNHGSRCTFPDFNCKSNCGFVDGIKGEREI